jgi:glucodextranase-like protein/FecR-like protein
MAKPKKYDTWVNVDWYLISVDRLRKVGLVVLLLLVGGAAWWFWHDQQTNPKSRAESAISDARQALNALAASPEFNSRRADFNRAQQKLDEANTHLTASRYDGARDAAVESQTISRAALSGGTELESDAQFLTIEGDVQHQKRSGEWRDADPRTPLVNGDWVKTGDRASAELIFSNGSLYTIGANALLEIYSSVNPGSSKKTNAVQMRVGSVEVATAKDTSTVRTPGTQVTIESDSTTHVGVDRSQATSIVASRGAASVSSEKGGPAVRVGIGERVSSTSLGELSPIKKLAMPPGLLSPGDNQVFQLSAELKVDLVWDTQEGATAYMLQVSRSRLFSTLEINTRRPNTTARAKVTSEGSFYWRVASIGTDGETGPFSAYRRFRVSGGGKAPITDRVPPVLTMRAPFHVGGQYFTVAGTTEPGATVFINDEEVDVESTGAFQKLVGFNRIGRNPIVVKAVDAAGNQTVVSQTVIVEE